MAQIMKYFKVNGFKRFCLYAEYNYNRDKSSGIDKGYLADLANGHGFDVVDDETTRGWKSWTNHHSLEGSLSAGRGICYLELKPAFNYRSDELAYAKGNLPALNPRRSYRYVSGRALFRIKSPKTGSLRVQYFMMPNIPDINYFVTYPDKADPQHIISGNDNLRKGTKQGVMAWGERYFTKDTEKGRITRTLYASLSFDYATNDVTNHATHNRATGVVVVKPVNVSGNRSGKLNVAFNTPLDAAQHFWVEAYSEASVVRTKTFVTFENDERPSPNDNRLYAYSLSVKPRAKFDFMDVSLGYGLTLEDNQGSYASVNNKEQWQHHLEGKLTCRLPWGLSLTADVNYHNYAGYLSGKRENWVMLNLEMERAFLKGKNLFAGVLVHDLFNRETGFQQQYGATALTRSFNKTLGRFAMLTLRYRFSTK